MPRATCIVTRATSASSGGGTGRKRTSARRRSARELSGTSRRTPLARTAEGRSSPGPRRTQDGSEGRRAKGRESTHWRTGTWENTRSTRCAAVSAMRRPPQDGKNARPLHERDEAILAAGIAVNTQEAVREDAAVEERAQFALDEPRHVPLTPSLPLEEALELGRDDAVEDGLFRAARRVFGRRFSTTPWTGGRRGSGGVRGHEATAVPNACGRLGPESRPWSDPSCTPSAEGPRDVRMRTPADGLRTDPSRPSAPRLQRAENRHDGPPCGTRKVLPRPHDDRQVVLRVVSALRSLCSRYSPTASVLRPVLSDRWPALAHGANGNSFCQSDLRPVVTDFRSMLSGFGRL